MTNRAVDQNVAAFSELSFAIHCQGMVVLQVTVVNYGSNVLQSC